MFIGTGIENAFNSAASYATPAAKAVANATANGLKTTANIAMTAAAGTGTAMKNVAEKSAEIASRPEVQSTAITTLKYTAGAGLAVGIATVALPAAGFTAAGVCKGSLAAAAHSSIGNVAAGSLFATLQSAGAAGMAVSTKFALGSCGAYLGSKL